MILGQEELLRELDTLRRRVAELEAAAQAPDRAQELLREKEEEWRLFSLATSNMLWRWEFADNSVERNSAFETAFGYSREEVLPKIDWWVERLHDQDRDRVLAVFQRALEAGEDSCAYEYRFRRRDDTFAHIADKVFIIRDTRGKGLRALGAMTDVGDRKRIEEEQARLASLESLGVLAGGIAHDFNNLLTAVSGNLSLLTGRLPEGSEEWEITAEARSAADRTRELVARLMTFAKGGEPQKEPGPIDDLIRRTTSLCLSGSKARAEFQIPEGLPAVDMDAMQVGQVVHHLVLNADQSMPDGGVITVSAKQIDLPQGDPPFLEPGNYVEVCVADEGEGMSEDLVSRIFDPYFSTKPKGHGLGLTTVHSILSKHKGHIRVTSEPGIGSRFTFRLRASEVEVTAGSKETEKHGLGGERIMVVDDQEAVRSVASRMLATSGYEVEGFDTAEAALEAYRASLDSGSPFDLVIMDLTLPGGMDGKQATAQLLDLAPGARVIVASGYSENPVLARPEDHGFVGRLSKPFTLSELTREVGRVLSLTS